MRAGLLACLSGVLACLPFRAFALYPLIFVAFVPLLVALSGAGWRRRLMLGWLAGVVSIAGGFDWVWPTIARFEGWSLLAALPFFALFVGCHALQFGVFAAAVVWAPFSSPSPLPPSTALRAGSPIRERGLPADVEEQCVAAGRSPLTARHSPLTAGRSPLTARRWPLTTSHCLQIASVWTLLEWGFPKIIPWNFGGVLVESAWLRQAADLGGAYGLSFVVAFVNSAVVAAVMNRDVRLGVRVRPVGVAAVVVAAVAVYGAVRTLDSRLRGNDEAQDSGLAVVIVQGGIESGRSDMEAANEEAWERYAALTRVGAVGVDLVVWPETVLRVYLRSDDAYRTRVEELVRRLGRPLLLGSLDLPEQGEGELNSAYLIEPDSNAAQIYHKTYLLPFGEYVPGARWLPFVQWWRTTGRFVEGRRAPSLTLPRGPTAPTGEGIKMGAAICFEAIRPGWFNAMVRDGAEFLVNITDDGWFGNTAAPYQHLQLARLRAVETRRWLVRASNSGISAFVDPSGEIVASLPLGVANVLRHSITPQRTTPLYVLLGNWLIAVCALAVLLPLVRGWTRNG
jgi:apolipoprotein N-acyltransferase